MSYTLPKTDKRFLRDKFVRPTPFCHIHQVSANNSYEEVITNPNDYAKSALAEIIEC